MAEEPDLVVSAGFSDAQLVKDANKVVAAFKKRGEEAQKAFQDAQGKVGNSQAARAHARELDRLSKAYDPAYRAASRYEAEVKKLDRALDVGAVTQTQYTARVASAAREMKQATEVVEQTAQGSRRYGGAMQQVGYQVGDFAVQVGAGTSAVQALGQQLPQLLGAFGAMGALAGAGAAILIPLGAALYRVATDSETLEERTAALTKSTDAYVDAAEAAMTPIEELRNQYGDLADEVARANSAMAMLSAIRARTDIMGAARGLSAPLGVNLNPDPLPVRGDGTVDPNREYMRRKEMERDLQRVKDLTGASAEQFEKLRMAINRVDSSNSVEAVARDAENLLATISELATNDGADLDFLGNWGSQVYAVMQQAQRQVEAGADAMVREQRRIVSEYQTDTDKLKKLTDDRASAQRIMDAAIKSGNEETARLTQERLDLIDAEISKVQALGRANDDAFVAMQKRIQQGAWGVISGAVESATGNSLEQWGKDLEASQRGILELIKSRESGGNYNATLDNGRYTGGQRDLVNMTLNEVLEMQRQMLAHPDNTHNSSAAGAYQIVSTTMRGLIKELGLSGNELYSREMQDRMAQQLLRQRMPQGMEGLRNEWEGLRGVSPAVIQQALGQQSIERMDPELQREADERLKEQVRDRERLAKQAKDYSDQLSASLITQQQTNDLSRQQAEQVAAIKALRLDPEAEARAIAQVTAEIERQRTVMALQADAKRRNVDLDAQLADGTMTYRQAIEALGAAKAADIVATNERAMAEGRAAEAQKFMADQQQQVEQGLVRSIAAGQSFTEVLANVAMAFAEAALQAALFNKGSWASGAGNGILGGISNLIFGGGDALNTGLRGAGLSPVRSFDGGGFTWSGPRSGGLDGKGGQLHMLHPNERVLDLTRGQTAGGGQSTIMVDLSPDLVARILDEAQGQSIRISQQTAAAQAKALPAQVQRIQANPRKR